MMELAFEARMLIDGKLVEATGGRTYDNINPATESVIGPVADASADDMDRAIDAARRAFDESEWATNRALRKAGLLQLKEALEKRKEELRPQIVAEVGTPIGLTYAVQQDSCIEDMQWDIDLIDRYEWEYELGSHEFFGMTSNRLVTKEPIGVAGLITPWNFPFMLNAVEARARARGGVHDRAEARARHAVLGDVDRQDGRRGDRHPARRRQRRHRVASRGSRRRAHRRSAAST